MIPAVRAVEPAWADKVRSLVICFSSVSCTLHTNRFLPFLVIDCFLMQFDGLFEEQQTRPHCALQFRKSGLQPRVVPNSLTQGGEPGKSGTALRFEKANLCRVPYATYVRLAAPATVKSERKDSL